MVYFILTLRFILEVSTIIGIMIGAFYNPDLISKVFFIVLAITLVILWYFFGAPNSPTAFNGINKLLLELFVYGIGIISFYYLFDFKIATTYTVLVIFDLSMMYLLNLQGN